MSSKFFDEIYNIGIINLKVTNFVGNIPKKACCHKTHKVDVVFLPYTIIQPLRQKKLNISVKIAKPETQWKKLYL